MTLVAAQGQGVQARGRPRGESRRQAGRRHQGHRPGRQGLHALFRQGDRTARQAGGQGRRLRRRRVHPGDDLQRSTRTSTGIKKAPPRSITKREWRGLHQVGDHRIQGPGQGRAQDLRPAGIGTGTTSGWSRDTSRLHPLASWCVTHLLAPPILIWRGLALSDLGSVRLRTPCSNCAWALSELTAVGSEIERWNEPTRRSRRCHRSPFFSSSNLLSPWIDRVSP